MFVCCACMGVGHSSRDNSLRELWGTNLSCLVSVESTVTQNLRAVLCGFIHGVLSLCLSDIGNMDQRCWPWHDKWEVGKSVQL